MIKEESLTLYLLEERWYMLIVEGELAAEQDIHDDACTPDVDFGAGIKLAGDDLRCCVVRAPARGLEEVAVGHEIRQTKVPDLDIAAGVEE